MQSSSTRVEHQHIHAFAQAMAEAGLPGAVHIVADNEIHRFAVSTDKKNGKRNGWYILYDDHPTAGAFGTWRGATHKWSAEGVAPLTAEEREEVARKSAERKAATERAKAEREETSAAQALAMWEAAIPCGSEHPYLRRKGVPAYDVRVGDWVKEKRDGGTYVAAKGALLIPMRDSSKKIWSLQAVFASPVKMGEDHRDKDFVYGGRKAGCWFTIGRPTEIEGKTWLAICEGYATGASVHRATGLGVVVAFDAKNMGRVAARARELMPDVGILICGDNDAWTKNTRGEPWNPGLEAAIAAAKAVGGVYAVPRFPAGLPPEEKPTDFNDLDALEGLESVRGQVMAAISPPAECAPEPEPEESAPRIDPDDNSDIGSIHDNSDDHEQHDGNEFFRVLGHDRECIYFYQSGMKMIVRRPPETLSESGLLRLAPLHWWERTYGKGGLKAHKLEIQNWLLRTAERAGYFDPDCMRGRGAWRDDGRIVYHFGNTLMVDGAVTPLAKIKSGFIYEQARRLRLPSETPLAGSDGRRIIELAQSFRWTREASAILWAGWIALAPVCGALTWRPHIWATGGAGCGKTTILNLAHWLMNGASIFAQGNSTEAGIRQKLRMDALPVLFDESEQNSERESLRVQAVLALIRQSSSESEAKTLKGTQGGEAMDFHIRSMFHLSSIQVGMKQQADVERLSVLALKPKRDEDYAAAEGWKKLSSQLAGLRADRELPARLMRRSLHLLPMTLENIELFAQAGAEIFGSQREGDQYGALFAGAWSLVSGKVATLDQAREMLKKYDFSDYVENSETEESEKALGALLGKLIRLKNGVEAAVGEIVACAADRRPEALDLDQKEAQAILRRHGLMVKWQSSRIDDAKLLLANHCPELERLMSGTPYAADLKGQLLRLPGAARWKNEQFAGGNWRCVAIPMPQVLPDLKAAQTLARHIDDDLPF